MTDEEIDSIAHHLGECESCLAVIEGLDSNPIMEGFRLALADDSESANPEFVETELGDVDEQVKSIIEVLGPILEDRKHGSEVYVLEEKISDENMCEVYRAHDVLLNEPYIVKLPHPHIISSEDHVARFIAETHRSSGINHDQVASIESYGHWDEERPYYSMRWFDLPTLEAFVEHGDSLSNETFLRITVQLCMAICEGHNMGATHRNLNPTTIFIHPNETILVSEFGLNYDGVFQFGLVQPLSDSTSFHSPESIANNHLRIDARTDVWAFGAIVDWLIDSTHPFPESTAKSLASLTHKCQRNSRSNRFQTMNEVSEQLRTIFAAQ